MLTLEPTPLGFGAKISYAANTHEKGQNVRHVPKASYKRDVTTSHCLEGVVGLKPIEI